MCGDFNAHSVAWGSKYTTCKGDRLASWTEKNNLILMNEGNSPTCVRPQGISIIDLTWATPIVANRIRDWKVKVGKALFVGSQLHHVYVRYRKNG